MNYFIKTLFLRNQILFYFGLVCLIFTIIFYILSKTSKIQVLGINAYIKPFKFALSTVFYSWTMTWFLGYLPNFDATFFNWTIIISLGFEIFYIALQASKGEMSHFNTSTPIKSFLFTMMGVLASIATLATAYIAWLFFKNAAIDVPNYYLWAIRLGLVLFVIFSFQGFLMGAKMKHTVGAPDGSKGIYLLNWSLSHGDLRIAHFIGMHAMQVIPLVSFYLLKNTILTFILTALYFGLALQILIQALHGKPIKKM